MSAQVSRETDICGHVACASGSESDAPVESDRFFVGPAWPEGRRHGECNMSAQVSHETDVYGHVACASGSESVAPVGPDRFFAGPAWPEGRRDGK